MVERYDGPQTEVLATAVNAPGYARNTELDCTPAPTRMPLEQAIHDLCESAIDLGNVYDRLCLIVDSLDGGQPREGLDQAEVDISQGKLQAMQAAQRNCDHLIIAIKGEVARLEQI